MSLELATERWKICHSTIDTPNPMLNLEQYDQILDKWLVLQNFLEYIYQNSYVDWCVAQPHEKTRNTATWEDFVATMEHYYKPTENPTLKNFQFRSITQHSDETFPSFSEYRKKQYVVISSVIRNNAQQKT